MAKHAKPLVLVLLLILAACESSPPRDAPAPAMGEGAGIDRDTPDIETLIARAARSAAPESTLYAVLAAELSLELDPAQARRILDAYPPIGSEELLRRYLLLNARIFLAENKPALALRTMDDNRLRSQLLTTPQQIAAGTIRAEAHYLGRSYLASARERMLLHNLLDDSEKLQNHELIFASLLELPTSTLLSQAERAITSDLRGWLSLAAMTKHYQHDPLQQLVELNKWKRVWAHHPAAANLPASLQMLSQVVERQAKAIALLLPLQGEMGPFGRAIRDGILSAHYAVRADTRIAIYDTSSNDTAALLDQAKREGAEVVIGPLDREQVTEISGFGRLPLPVLALNRTLDGSVSPDLYQFGLAPEDEVIQVANQVFREGKRNALVLYVDSDWGERNFTTFRDSFQQMGGNIVSAAAYDNQRDYSDLVKRILNVDDSEARAAELQRITGQRFEFTPRRRQDIDFVFLLANPRQARQLNPTLAFYYAEDIPVYSTSHVHEYSESRIETIDLNGIRFCDIPFKLTASDKLQTRVQQIWHPAKASLAAFYALGIDAYRLYPRLQQLKEIPGSRMFGATGVLTLNAANVINRELMWAHFKDGVATSMPMIFEAEVVDQ